ncbi:6-phospho-3-hexuloisomerase [Desulfurococcus mucosus]|uniref:3-hexulose-6-phosphate isomerase n=1 Tax=Desulfurococcus mucosus (strain ATCC 35584 / DSM 2162 / JCM 9187 / O7/1) TaxID=765177 RepID=E8R9S7_DESM0|nr:6-phospho-3-hexuloisomerase [Desulfurococcus mucosus]ADV65253.1 3-hexulose-6-phosphate isomerase [Desulfurococcus mucosus DSM 2162]
MVSGTTRDAVLSIVDFVLKAVDLISDEEKEKMISTLIDALKNGRKVFIIGAGRSGLVGKAFAMRLLHLGFNVYVVGETILPRASQGDVLVSISGSGRTRLVVAAAEAARSVGVKVIAITTYPDSPLGRIADIVVKIPGRTKMSSEEDYISRQILGLHEPLAPLGTLFEDTLLLFLDGVVVELMERLGVSEEDLRNRHANIE